jgi:hypothetical protein
MIRGICYCTSSTIAAVISLRTQKRFIKDSLGGLLEQKKECRQQGAKLSLIYCYPTAVAIFGIFSLHRRPGNLVRDFLAALLFSSVGGSGVFIPGIVKGCPKDFLSMFGQIVSN